MSMPSKVLEADFIIVGGGSAGCVLAARLAEYGFETLLISSGSDDTSNPLMTEQSEFSNLMRQNIFKHHLYPNPSHNLNNRILEMTVWNTLGGSSVNSGGMERMGANDWQYFANAVGDSGFLYENMNNYYKMTENFTSLNPFDAQSVHGRGGPIKITKGYDRKFEDLWKKVASELGQTFTTDLADNVDYGFSFEPSAFTNGIRSWSGRDYLVPAMAKYPNLKVLSGATAINFDFNENTKRIASILFVASQGVFHGIARKEFILSAGTFYSPQLLMLSGIGDPEILQRNEIRVKHVLKQVGKNLMDNGVVVVQYEAENLPIKHSIPVGLINTQLFTTSDNPEAFFILKMDQKTKNLFVVIFNASPKTSIGSVSLNNANPLASPKVVLEYLQDKRDTQIFIDSINYVRKVMSTDTLKEYGPFTEIAPGTNEQNMFNYVRDHLSPAYHFVGTCCMGMDNQTSVVDKKFKVHGIENLRIVDASIFPAGLSSRTGPCLTIYALAEKAADMLRSEYD